MNKRNILALFVILVITLNVTPVFACHDSTSKYLEVTKELTCEHGDGYTDNPLYFELDGTRIYPDDPRYEIELGGTPVYAVGQKITFWMKITVTANTNLKNVIVCDRLGAELMLDAIAYDSFDEVPDHEITYEPYMYGGNVIVDGNNEGLLNKIGVEFEDLKVYWTGNSLKAHIQWNVGEMEEGEERRLYLIVSTDTNPSGKQEYTSCGIYTLNSGATVKGCLVDTNKQVSAVSNSIVIKVITQKQDTPETPEQQTQEQETHEQIQENTQKQETRKNLVQKKSNKNIQIRSNRSRISLFNRFNRFLNRFK